MRLLKAFLAAVTIAAIVFGSPILLTKIGRLDSLGSLQPTLASLPDLVVGSLTIIAWLAWAACCLSLVFEFIYALSAGQVRLSLPGLRVFSSSSALLVTALLGLASAATSQPQAPDIVQSQPAVQAETQDQNEADAEQDDGQQFLSYTTAEGDDLWTLAEQHLGDGMLWRQIAEANDTVLGSPTEAIRPGMRLLIPIEQASPAVSLSEETPAEENHVTSLPEEKELDGVVEVKQGDSLWAIAATELGDPNSWPQIYEANSDLITDPGLIKPGWQLKLPGSVPVAEDVAREAHEQAEPEVAEAVEPETSEPALQQIDTSAFDEVVPCPVDTEAPPDSPGYESRDVYVSAFEEAVSCPVEAGSALSLESPQLESATADLGPTAAAIASHVSSVAGISAALAATISAAIYRRRNRQQVQRPLGKAIRKPKGEAKELESAITALGALSTDAWHAVPNGLKIRVGREMSSERDVEYDFFSAGSTAVVGPNERVLAFANGVILGCLGDESAIDVVASGSSFDWLVSLDEPSLQVLEPGEAGEMLAAELRERRIAGLSSLGPEVCRKLFVFEEQPEKLPSTEQLRSSGVAVLLCGAEILGPTFQVADQTAKTPDWKVFAPEMVSAPARRGLEEIFDAASSTEYEPAEWWQVKEASRDDVARQLREQEKLVKSTHPTLLLLGPVSLEGARGKTPPRALKQCQEYCAWLLEHPASTATQMTKSLLVAEGTRRSNMSRLRTWLGADDNGSPYLPEAYSGRIRLHPGVSSDWEQFRTMLIGGIDRASDDVLRSALELVRGAPLADAAPGQWSWAEPLRVAMASMIRDAGLQLGRRALERRDIETARWAAAKGLLAVPEDELLLGLRLKTEHLAGNDVETDRLVLHITRQARQLGVDLLDETVALLQETVEGQARARAV